VGEEPTIVGKEVSIFDTMRQGDTSDESQARLKTSHFSKRPDRLPPVHDYESKALTTESSKKD
jgi:hypothetical protein